MKHVKGLVWREEFYHPWIGLVPWQWHQQRVWWLHESYYRVCCRWHTGAP